MNLLDHILHKSPYESPIEERLASALHQLGQANLKILPQAQLGQYRVDFLVEGNFDPASERAPAMVVVECDGDAYHNSARQRRADMDRQSKFLALGLSVIRFTGAEINSDARRCAQNVLEILHGQYWRSAR